MAPLTLILAVPLLRPVSAVSRSYPTFVPMFLLALGTLVGSLDKLQLLTDELRDAPLAPGVDVGEVAMVEPPVQQAHRWDMRVAEHMVGTDELRQAEHRR